MCHLTVIQKYGSKTFDQSTFDQRTVGQRTVGQADDWSNRLFVRETLDQWSFRQEEDW